MPLLLNDSIFKNGFCWGQYEPKIDDESRLHLPKEVVDILEGNGITKLWRCPDPTGERFVLCPSQHRLIFIKMIKDSFKDSEEVEEVYRLLCSGTEAAIDSQGRIRIQKVCLDHVKVNAGKRVNVLGVGRWYEVTPWEFGSAEKR